MLDKSNLKNAAIVLKSLPEHQAAKVMANLEPRELDQILKAADSNVQPTMRDVFSALDQLSRQLRNSPLPGPVPLPADSAIRFDSEPEENSVAPNREGPFGFLTKLAPEIIHQAIRDEHPKHIAIVLSALPPEIASDQIRKFDSVQRVAVVRRMCELENSRSQNFEGLESAIKFRVQKILGRRNSRKSVSLAARVLEQTDESTRNEVLSEIGTCDAALELELQDSLQSFDDLAQLGENEMKRLLAVTDTALWAPALWSARETVREKVLTNMAPKAAQVLLSEIASIKLLADCDSKSAQRKIVANMPRR